MEPQLTEYDSICGDGDCGVVMKAGASLILKEIASIEAAAALSASSFCSKVADVISASMGGTSGALIELMLRNMAVYFVSTEAGATTSWQEALLRGVQAMQFYGGATVGMRTMLDALVIIKTALFVGVEVNHYFYRFPQIPATDVLMSSGGDLALSAAKASEGAESTKTMKPLAGRCSMCP